jgi:hypothetical protein
MRPAERKRVDIYAHFVNGDSAVGRLGWFRKMMSMGEIRNLWINRKIYLKDLVVRHSYLFANAFDKWWRLVVNTVKDGSPSVGVVLVG